MFAAVAPASARTGANTITSVTTSKAIRATDTLAAGHTTGTGTGILGKNLPAVIVNFDDSLTDLYTRAGGTFNTTDTAADADGDVTGNAILVMTLRSRPSTNASLAVDDTLAAAGNSTDLPLNTAVVIGDDSLMSNFGRYTLTGDDTGLAFSVIADEVGAYTVDIFLDINNNGVLNNLEPATTATINVYGTPTLTAAGADSTLLVGYDDTITLSLTGGALSAEEEFESYILAEMNGVSLFSYVDTTASNTNVAKSSRHSAVAVDDETLILDDSMAWSWSANVATLSLVVRSSSSADDVTGSVTIVSKSGLHVSGITITYAASTLKSDIKSAYLSAPIKNIDPVPTSTDDTVDVGNTAGQYQYDILKGQSALVVSGGFQLNSASNYGGSVTVSLYGAADPTNADTALASSTVVTNAAGAGTFSFTIPNLEIDDASEVVTVTIGGVAEVSALTGPKQIVLTARTAAPAPTYTVGDYKWEAAQSQTVTRLNQAAASTVTASISVADQFGNAMTGYIFKMTSGSTARNAGLLKEATVSASGAATLTYVDAGTATTDDTLSLFLLNVTKDETLAAGTETMTVNFGTATLAGFMVNGETPAERKTNAYVSRVPGLGSSAANGTAAAANDSTNLNKVEVTVTGGSNVKFTGSAGVRFTRASVDRPMDAGVGTAAVNHDKGSNVVYAAHSSGVVSVFFFCITAGDCTVTASVGSVTSSAAVAYETDAAYARNISDIKINDAAATSGTSSADKKVKVSFKVTDVFGNPVKTLGQASVAVDFIVSGVGSLDGFGNQGTLKTAADGTAIFYATSSAAGLQQITLDGAGGEFDALASTTLNTPAGDAVKTVALTWSAAPAPEVVYAAPTLTVTKSGTKIILDGTAVEGEGDIIVYIKRVGTTKWVEQAATIEVAAPGDYNGMRTAPKSNVLIRVKQEGTGKFSNQVVVLK
jgi:phosphotransferase system HPr-like phosphotransfer protein